MTGRDRYNSFKGLFLLQAAVLLVCVISSVFHKLPLITGVIYFFFQLAGILLPGAAVTGLITKEKRGIAFLAYSYAFGFGVLIIEYLLLVPFGLQYLTTAVSVAIAVVSVVLLYKMKPEIKTEKKDWLITLPFIAAVFVIDFLTVSVRNMLPGEVAVSSYENDMLFWVQNSISLANGFPAETLSLAGKELRYHHFSSMIVAMSHLISGIDIRQISFYFSFLISGPFLVLTGYALFSDKIRKPFFLVSAMILYLFTDGSSVTYACHIYTNPFGFDYGLAYCILAIYTLFKLRKNAFSWRWAAISSGLIALMTGFKGPVSVVGMMGFGVAGIIYLTEKKWKEAFLYGICWLSAFFLIYYGFIWSSHVTETIGYVGISAIKTSWWIREIHESLWCYGKVPALISYLLAVVLYVFNANRVAVGLLLIAVIALIKGLRKKFNVFDALLCCSIGCWGILLTVMINQTGSSQMYFVMAAYPFCLLSGLLVVERYDFGKNLRGTCLWVLTAVLSVSSINVVQNYYFRADVGKGVYRLLGRESSTEYYSCDSSDDEAFRWIRENTEQEDVIAMPEYEYSRDGNLCTYRLVLGAFAERTCYNDGTYAYSNEVVEDRTQKVLEYLLGSDRDAEVTLKKDRVRYILYKKDTVEGKIRHEDSIVFENASFVIFRVF